MSTTPQQAPFWKRSLAMARILATSWPSTLPRELRELGRSLVIVLLNIVGLLTVLAVPFLFWTAPLWVKVRERAQAKAEREMVEFAEFLDKHYPKAK